MRRDTKRNTAKLLLAIFIVWLLFRPKWYSSKFGSIVTDSSPHRVWEFVSDLTNAKLLNPAIYEFDIVHDKGTYDHWEYGAVIYEKMFRIPLLTNVNYATFIVKPQTKDDRYEISSQYKTCFFGYACLFSKSQMVFSREGFSSTKFQETIEYQCPIILFWLCPKELADNRNEWLHNLKKHFHK